VQSQAYNIEVQHFFPDIVLTSEACPMWVPLIENNQHHTLGAEYFIRHHLDNLLKTDADIDSLILGCTHYPLIQNQIQAIVGDAITVVAQGEIVAKSLKEYLFRHPEIESQCST
jgi:glutamate racemase